MSSETPDSNNEKPNGESLAGDERDEFNETLAGLSKFLVEAAEGQSDSVLAEQFRAAAGTFDTWATDESARPAEGTSPEFDEPGYLAASAVAEIKRKSIISEELADIRDKPNQKSKVEFPDETDAEDKGSTTRERLAGVHPILQLKPPTVLSLRVRS